jgi:hypothetical protein
MNINTRENAVINFGRPKTGASHGNEFMPIFVNSILYLDFQGEIG